jgi:glycosyltransferase involved in cell wall biosynthesis
MIQRARLLVSASLTEGCPNVIQQALACGTPIVATDCPGGTSEILENGRWGRLVPVADPESMAAAILASLDDPNPPDGRIRAADFTPEKTTRAYLDVLLPGFNPRQVPGLPEE